MQLPVFEGVVEALEKHGVNRKRSSEIAKTTPAKKRRVCLKRKRIREGLERIKWSKRQGLHSYFGGHNGTGAPVSGESRSKGKCAACGSKTHRRSSHRDCPHHKSRVSCAGKEDRSKSDEYVFRYVSDSEVVSNGDLSDSGSSNDAPSDSCTSEECIVGACTFVAERRAHKRG